MKKYMNRLMVMCGIVLLAASCQEDGEVTTLSTVTFPDTVTATPDNVVLTTENKYDNVLTVSWEAPDFPVDAPVTYALQLDVANDTIGGNAWSNAVTLQVGEDAMSKSFLGNELNTIARDFGIAPDTQGQLVARVSGTLDRTVYSHAVAFDVTTYEEVITQTEIYVPGQYQGWDPATAATLQAVENGVFQGLLTFPEGELEFKFTTEPNWDHPYGNDAGGNFAEGGDTTNLVAPAAGTYQITVNLNTMSYTLTPYSFGIIGTATPGAWDYDTDMSWDYQNQYWTWTGHLVAGALKFRLNDDWTVNYGANSNDGNTMYYDNQGAYTVAAEGDYTVTFAVNPDPATATYSVTQL